MSEGTLRGIPYRIVYEATGPFVRIDQKGATEGVKFTGLEPA